MVSIPILVRWSFFSISFGKILRVLEELLSVLSVLFRKITSQGMVRFGLVDEGDESLDDL